MRLANGAIINTGSSGLVFSHTGGGMLTDIAWATTGFNGIEVEQVLNSVPPTSGTHQAELTWTVQPPTP